MVLTLRSSYKKELSKKGFDSRHEVLLKLLMERFPDRWHYLFIGA